MLQCVWTQYPGEAFIFKVLFKYLLGSNFHTKFETSTCTTLFHRHGSEVLATHCRAVVSINCTTTCNMSRQWSVGSSLRCSSVYCTTTCNMSLQSRLNWLIKKNSIYKQISFYIYLFNIIRILLIIKIHDLSVCMQSSLIYKVSYQRCPSESVGTTARTLCIEFD